MIPKRVTLENFLSYGPRTEIAFADDEPLWVVSGPNGVGKSAVFDAITYCLFAEHRGGKQGHDQLIRKGENGFSVAFEFEFAGKDFRISRSRSGKRATQQVEHRPNGAWERVKDVDGTAAVDERVRQTLGLSFDAFTASVLLRQGKADDILDATPDERLKTLKKIIGVERYEELSGRVGAARKGKDAELKRLQQQRSALTEVTDAEVAEATAEVERATATRDTADIARRDASTVVPVAKQWVGLCGRRDDLTRKLAEADSRATDADAIRADHARFAELSAVVPLLRKLIPLRTALADAVRDRATAVSTAARLRTELEESRSRGEALKLTSADQRRIAVELAAESSAATTEHGRQSSFLTLADEIARLRTTTGGFLTTLDVVTVTAGESLHQATADERAASAAASEMSALLKQAKEQQAKFGKVAVGVTCSHCGQEVMAEHAEKERQRLADRVTELTATWAAARDTASTVAANREKAEAQLRELTDRIADRDRIAQRLADQERSLTALGGTADAVAIRAELLRLEARRADFQRRHAEARSKHDDADRELKSLGSMVAGLESEVRAAELDVNRLSTAVARDTAARDALLEQLLPEWHDTGDASPHSAELERLTAAGIEARFCGLEQDAALRDEWERQRGDVEGELAAIPEVARVPVAVAAANLLAAEAAFRTADTEYRTAVTNRDDITRRRTRLDELTAAIADAEKEVRIHAKLDTLLGKQKLQRELIREAEAAIVRLAHQTLDKLSAGDLSIALADAEDGDDKAFELEFSRGDDPTPIGVKYLSGSQKFRVAISIALAIGRFASGQARPMESVIIDEGFGSLDKDGLRAAAEELNRLKDHLRRIILVSHQEEFTDRFPAVIRLTQGEHGTTAEQVRNRG